MRLDQFLARRVPSVSRMRLRQAVDAGESHVNGEARPAGWRVSMGDSVRLLLDSEQTSGMTPEAIPFAVLYEDHCLIVLEKPAGMVVHPAGRHRSGTLLNALTHHFNVVGAADPPIRPGLAHRLDRSTSGLMVVAKSQEALSRLTVGFQRREVTKRYTALVHGHLPDPAGEWDAPIGAAADASPRWGVRPEGRPARTRFQVREQCSRHTLLELEPVTGRTNQLRLHCAHFGHPIVGDELFGTGGEPELGRLFLHAHLLCFYHPVSGEALSFESPLPDELARYLATACGSEAGQEA